jgi:ribosomal protein S18 acetylase RimI-like enzyme
MPKVEIRRLTTEDYDAMVKVWERAGLPYKPKGRDSRQNIAKQTELFPEFYIGAFHGTKLVGVAIASYESRMKGWINRLAVDPEYQRHGVAEQLVRKAEESLKKRGAKIFCALIELPNDKSVGLFQKLGYALHRDILYVSKRESRDV